MTSGGTQVQILTTAESVATSVDLPDTVHVRFAVAPLAGNSALPDLRDTIMFVDDIVIE